MYHLCEQNSPKVTAKIGKRLEKVSRLSVDSLTIKYFIVFFLFSSQLKQNLEGIFMVEHYTPDPEIAKTNYRSISLKNKPL